jgi:predicted metal-dependent peptidase
MAIQSWTQLSTADKLMKSRVQMRMHLPFYGNLLSNLFSEEDNDTVQTMATDGDKIIYNSEFVETLTLQELSFIHAHEVMHVALGHLWRRGARDPKLWNIATDYAINNILMESINPAYLKPTDGVLIDPRFKGMSAEEIYSIIYEKLASDPNYNSGEDEGEGQGDEEGEGDGRSDLDRIKEFLKKHGFKISEDLDDHEPWNTVKAQENKDFKTKSWMMKLAGEADRCAGSCPLGAKRAIEQLMDPKKDWRDELMDCLAQETTDYSFNPPDRRYSDMKICEHDFFLPDFNEMEDVARDVLFWIDTSGSVSEHEITVFYSEIVGAMRQYNEKLTGYLGFFDSEVYEPIPIDNIESVMEIVPKGGGGTSFEEVLNHTQQLIEDGQQIMQVVIFTDGYASYPDVPPFDAPILWVMTDKQNTAPFGRTTYLEN